MPSGARDRTFKCRSCSGLYNLSDTCRIAATIGGLLGMFPAILLFGRIVKAGGGSRLAIFAGTVVVALGFSVVSILAGLLTLRLQPKS